MCCSNVAWYNCSAANAACNAGGTTHLILKMIANSNAFTFSASNDDPSSA